MKEESKKKIDLIIKKALEGMAIQNELVNINND